MSLPVPLQSVNQDMEYPGHGSDSERDYSSGASDSMTDRASSPAPSMTPSVYSFTSSVDGRSLVRDVHGRRLNATSDTYMLPADESEHSRLDLQHELFRRKLGGLFLRPDAVRRALAPRQDVTPAVLDIGTGSGSWAIDMAKLFAHVEVTGLDLAPANLTSTPPPNCRFECDDANLGLGHYKDSFNVVHGRLICIGITDYRALLGDIANMLRPGGVYLSLEADMQLYDQNFEAITSQSEDEPGFTWLQKIAFNSYCAMKERVPGGIDAGYLIPRWLKSMDCWEEWGEKKIYIPVGAWEEDMNERQRQCADMMREDTINLVNSLRPLLVSHGYFEETVDGWIAKATDEIQNVRKKQYIRCHCAWAIKKQDVDAMSPRGRGRTPNLMF